MHQQKIIVEIAHKFHKVLRATLSMALITACAGLEGVLHASTSSLREHMERWCRGEIAEFDLECVQYYRLSDYVIAALEDLMRRDGGQDAVLSARSGQYAVALQMYVRQDAVVVLRHTIQSPNVAEEGLVGAVGWISNTVWRATPAPPGGETFIEVDYEKGDKYNTALDALRDREGDVHLAALWLLRIMGGGLPQDVQEIKWNDNDVEFMGTMRAGEGWEVQGKLSDQGGGKTALEYTVSKPPTTGTNGSTEVVTMKSSQGEGVFPDVMRLGSGSDARTFSNVVLRMGPAVRKDVGLSVTDFIKTHPSVVLVTVLSNGWQYAAYSGGTWVQAPPLTRSTGGDIGIAGWCVRVILGALLLAPLWLLGKQRVKRLRG